MAHITTRPKPKKKTTAGHKIVQVCETHGFTLASAATVTQAADKTYTMIADCGCTLTGRRFYQQGKSGAVREVTPAGVPA